MDAAPQNSFCSEKVNCSQFRSRNSKLMTFLSQHLSLPEPHYDFTLRTHGENAASDPSCLPFFCSSSTTLTAPLPRPCTSTACHKLWITHYAARNWWLMYEHGYLHIPDYRRHVYSWVTVPARPHPLSRLMATVTPSVPDMWPPSVSAANNQ